MAEIALPPGFKLDPTFKPVELPEGYSLDPTFKPDEVSTLEDIKRTIPSRLAKGVADVGGMAKDASERIDKVISYFGMKAGASPETISRLQNAKNILMPGFGVAQYLPSSEDVQKKIEEHTGPLYEPKTPAGKIVGGGMEMVPSALTGGWAGGLRGILSNALKFGVVPGMASEGAGQLAEQQGLPANVANAARLITGVATPAITHFGLSPNRFTKGEFPESEAAYARHVRNVESAGIPVSAGDRANSKNLRILEDELNHNNNIGKLEAVTRAATRAVPEIETTGVLRHGVPGDPGSIGMMRQRQGAEFDRLQNANTLHLDAPLALDLLNTHDQYTRVPGLFNQETINTVRGVMQRVADVMKHPTTQTMTGEEYQTLTSDLRRAARSSALTNPDRAAALHDITDALDNAMERSIQAHNPRDLGAFRNARTNYKNGLVLEHAAEHSSLAGAMGYITPASLEAASKSVYGKRAHEVGHDPFYWAPSAKSVLQVEGNSNTAPRSYVKQMISGVSRGVGALAGSLGGRAMGMHDAVEPLLIAENMAPFILDPAVRKIARGAVMSGPGQAYLGNQFTRGSSHPYHSLPGLLTQNEIAKRFMENAQ